MQAITAHIGNDLTHGASPAPAAYYSAVCLGLIFYVFSFPDWPTVSYGCHSSMVHTISCSVGPREPLSAHCQRRWESGITASQLYIGAPENGVAYYYSVLVHWHVPVDVAYSPRSTARPRKACGGLAARTTIECGKMNNLTLNNTELCLA